MEIPREPTDLPVEVSAIYHEQLIETWGDPKKVADAALNELFRSGAELDYDDQVKAAMEIGILAGASHEASVEPEVFTYHFVNGIMSENL
jgi:hypothetical protein